MKTTVFADADKKLKPIDFFVGRTPFTGVVENRVGKPTARTITETNAVRNDSIIYTKQDLFTEGGKKNQRTWKLKVKDEHYLDATANDIDGTAHCLSHVNNFS